MSESHKNVLIDRIAANEADAADVRAFELHASRDPQAWEELARALRDELHLRAASQAEDHAARAEAEIARAADFEREAAHEQMPPTAASRFSFRSWSGWAAAAMVALAWVVYDAPPQTAPDAEPGVAQSPSTAPEARFASLTAADAYEQYLQLGHDEGRIIQELPARMVEMESAEDGAVVVYYVRQLLERERVNEMYHYAEDELGRPMPVPIDFTSFSVTDSSL